MYAKIFSSIFEGSMRGHPDELLVFVNMLCHCDRDGVVDRHWKAIADETGLSERRVKAAVIILEGPDKHSRSRNDDGKRLKRIDQEREWGWVIVNFKKYDAIRSAADRRDYMRDLMREKRENTKKNADVSSMLAVVSNPLAPVSVVSPSDSDSDSDSDLKNKIAVKVKPSQPASRFKLLDEDWIKSLRPDCEKQGISIDDQVIKMKRWLSGHPGRKMTQRFVINWLNKCDRIIASDSVKIKHDPRQDFGRAVFESANQLWGIKTRTVFEEKKESDFSDCLSALRDKYKDIPMQGGETVIDAALGIIRAREKVRDNEKQ